VRGGSSYVLLLFSPNKSDTDDSPQAGLGRH
jgi:hypothetical protein